MLQFQFVDRSFKLNAVFDIQRLAAMHGMTQLFRPTDITFDPVTQLLYTTDSVQHRICKFTLGGIFIMAFGSRGSRPGELTFPSGVAVAPSGETVAVSDTSNRRIQLFSNSGTLHAHRFMPARPPGFKSKVTILGGLMFSSQGKSNLKFFLINICRTFQKLTLVLVVSGSQEIRSTSRTQWGNLSMCSTMT